MPVDVWDPPGAGVLGGWEPSDVGTLNWTLEERLMLLKAEASLQPPCSIYFNRSFLFSAVSGLKAWPENPSCFQWLLQAWYCVPLHRYPHLPP